MAKYGGFKGVGNYIAVVGPKGEDVKLGYAALDLGIVKCHFEIGAGKENFSWA